MPIEIIDLDVVLEAQKRVKLGGKVYALPAQIPVALYLKIKAQQESGESDNILESMHEQVLELFQVYQPELETVPCGMGQLFEIIPAVYSTESEKPTRRQTTARTGSAKPKNSARAHRKPSNS